MLTGSVVFLRCFEMVLVGGGGRTAGGRRARLVMFVVPVVGATPAGVVVRRPPTPTGQVNPNKDIAVT